MAHRVVQTSKQSQPGNWNQTDNIMFRWLRPWYLAALLLLMASPHQAVAAEQGLKLAFLYNFVKFTDWPARSNPTASGRVDFCIIGGDSEFDDALESLAGRNVRGLPLRTRVVSRVSELPGCQVVFLPNSTGRAPGEIARAAAASGVLSVGEGNDFLNAGGMISLVTTGNRIQFDVNQAAVQGAGLNLNAQLLKLAHSVR